MHLGELVARDWSTSTEAGTEINFAVVVWSRAEGRSEGLAIADQVVALLHDAALVLDGFRLVNLRHLTTETARVGEARGAADGGAVQGGVSKPTSGKETAPSFPPPCGEGGLREAKAGWGGRASSPAPINPSRHPVRSSLAG